MFWKPNKKTMPQTQILKMIRTYVCHTVHVICYIQNVC